MSADYVPLNTAPYTAHQLVIGACRGASTVLDVGCSGGALASELSGRFGMVVDGIESDAAAAEAARRYCRTVVCADVESLDPSLMHGRRYDAILLADVLEHLRDPAGALRRVVPLLEPDGWVVISTPNIANWTMRLLLLAGWFEYTERGIMDRTHVHFFTRRSLLRLLSDTGLRVVHFDVTCPVPVMRERLSGLAHSLGSLLPGLLAYQFVVTARPVHS